MSGIHSKSCAAGGRPPETANERRVTLITKRLALATLGHAVEVRFERVRRCPTCKTSAGGGVRYLARYRTSQRRVIYNIARSGLSHLDPGRPLFWKVVLHELAHDYAAGHGWKFEAFHEDVMGRAMIAVLRDPARYA